MTHIQPTLAMLTKKILMILQQILPNSKSEFYTLHFNLSHHLHNKLSVVNKRRSSKLAQQNMKSFVPFQSGVSWYHIISDTTYIQVPVHSLRYVAISNRASTCQYRLCTHLSRLWYMTDHLSDFGILGLLITKRRSDKYPNIWAASMAYNPLIIYLVLIHVQIQRQLKI